MCAALHKRAKRRAEELQSDLAAIMTNFLIGIVFGIASPILLVLTLACAWFNLCARVHLNSHPTDTSEETPNFGETLAQTILIHPCIDQFSYMAMIGNWTLTAFIFIDLEFDLGPVVFFAIYSGVKMALFVCLRGMYVHSAIDSLSRISLFSVSRKPGQD